MNILKNKVQNWKETFLKKGWIAACIAPLLFLTDIFLYVVVHKSKSIKDTNFENISWWILYIFVFIFIFLIIFYLLYCLAVSKLGINISLIIISFCNLISIIYISRVPVAIFVWIFTDIIISIIFTIKFDGLKIESIFKTIEVTETYHRYGKEIKKQEKTYPVALPIIVAIISASGAIIAAAIAKR